MNKDLIQNIISKNYEWPTSFGGGKKQIFVPSLAFLVNWGLFFQNTFVQPILVQKDGKPFQEDRNLWKSTAVLVSLSSPTKFLI